MSNKPDYFVFWMIYCALVALFSSIYGPVFVAYIMIVCTCWWMFRVWEGLRSQKHGEGQP